MNILFLVPYPQGEAPSQRFRFEQYLVFLEEKGVTYKLESFLDSATWSILYMSGYTFKKVAGILKGILKRIKTLFYIGNYDFVFIHREAAPLGPPLIEWIIAKVWKKKIIYDFDDAIWIPNTSDANNIAARLKWHHKVGLICSWSYKVSCGNEYLREYALQFNSRAIYNPTTLDTKNLHNPALHIKQPNYRPVIGWTGTHSTLIYLEPLIPVLQELEKEYDFEFCVIANKNPELPLRSFHFVPWSKETEIKDLLRFDIGLMPLVNDNWANGKCGFKALQYMSLGIPALVSPVGVNKEIVDNGINGYICNNKDEWEVALTELLKKSYKRKEMGIFAKEKVRSSYSVNSNKTNFLRLFSSDNK
jgi:glycosyltransferase involved in cell wall biosynthesis